jgi:hypothetical protein
MVFLAPVLIFAAARDALASLGLPDPPRTMHPIYVSVRTDAFRVERGRAALPVRWTSSGNRPGISRVHVLTSTPVSR